MQLFRANIPPFFLVVCLLQIVAGHAPSVQGAPRNIILIVADDLSPDLGCYGNKAVKTPHMDRLATEATLFQHAYATTASCSASRSVILSGLHNHSNGQFGHLHNYHHFVTQPWVQSLPELLRRQGYRTARIGKYHVGPEKVFHFDEEIAGDVRNPVQMAGNCRQFIESNSEAPFFLYLATADPHRGGGFAEELPNRPDRFGNLPGGKLREGQVRVTYDPKEVVVPPFLPDTPECRAELVQYYQAVSRVDQGIGRLREILEASGHWNDTLILVTSDHGMAFAGAKTTVYEAGLRIPFLVRNPYQPLTETVRSDALVSLLDITPTLVDFAGGLDPQTGRVKNLDQKKWQWHTFQKGEGNADGVETGEMRWLPYTFHGRSFLPTLGQTHTPGWDSLTASHTFHEIQMYYPMRVYRDRQFKLIWNVAYEMPFPFASDLWKSPTWQTQHKKGADALYGFRRVSEVIRHPQFELFDMRQDPEERTNLADDPAYAEVLARHIEKLKAFQLATGDPWMLKWKYD